MSRARAVAARARRELAYLVIGWLTSMVAFVTWVAGLSLSLSLAVFVVGLPVFALSALAFRAVANAGRLNAALVGGRPLASRYRPRPPGGAWARLLAPLRDPQTWRDLGWLVVHSLSGFAFGTAALVLFACTLGVALLPAWYWAVPDGVEIVAGAWTVDTLGEAFATALLAVPLAALTLGVLRLGAWAESSLARALLAPAGEARAGELPAGAASPRPLTRRDIARALPVHAALAALAGSVATLVWGLTGAGTFWPGWIWIGVGASVALHTLALRALAARGDRAAVLRVRAVFYAVVALVCVLVWALAGGGYFWPVWPALALSVGLGLRTLVAFRDRLPWLREHALAERVDELARTRRGALDVQAAELRRIERDIHDGAQARLVSLAMLMGRAEDQLDDRPETAALVRRAREEAGAAIGELRDLARGIAPPVLADRGLRAAVEALAARAPMEVTVHAHPGERPAPAIETAAYFVVAEALTNVAKHAGGTPAEVSLDRTPGALVIEVTDSGPGGADPRGSGLTGLRHRVEALDGRLEVRSVGGRGTTIRAELPCAS